MSTTMADLARTRFYLDGLIQLYAESPPVLGAADILSANADDALDRAVAFAVFMLGVKVCANETTVKRVILVLPPLECASSLEESAIWGGIIGLLQQQVGRELNSNQVTNIQKRIALLRTRDLSISSAVAALSTVTREEVTVLSLAASYRADKVSVGVYPAEPIMLKEDQWVLHLTELARVATEHAKEASCYVLIDSGELSPHKEHNQSALMSISGCGFFSILPTRDPAGVLAAHIQTWAQQVAEGRIGSAFASVDALPGWMDSQKPVLKLQLLDRVSEGLDVLKLEILKRLRSEVDGCHLIDSSMGAKLARIAQRAGDEHLACEILGRVAETVVDQEDLELALDLAQDLKRTDLADEIKRRLLLFFPASPKPLTLALAKALNNRSYKEIISLLDAPHPGISEDLEFFYRTVAGSLQSDGYSQYPDLVRIVAKGAPQHENWARLICANEAIERNRFEDAFALCIYTDGALLNVAAARMLLHVTQQALLRRDGAGRLIIDSDELIVPVTALVAYVAAHPRSGRIRLGLEDLLDAATTGLRGLAVATSLVLQTANVIVSMQKPKVPNGQIEVDLESFFKSVLGWMAQESPLVLSRVILPTSLLPTSPDATLEQLQKLIEYQADIQDPESAKLFDGLVKTAILLAPHTNTPNEDLSVIRYAGTRLAAANRLQAARDLAETALGLTVKSAVRRRLAWLAFADIYHRCKNNIAALIGLACMFMSHAETDVAQIWQEIYLLIRVLRDLHLFAAATEAVERLQTVLDESDAQPAYRRRLKTASLSIEGSRLSQSDFHDSSVLTDLTERVVAHCVELKAANEEISPGLSLLVHCIRLAELHGIAISEATTVFAQKLMSDSSPGFGALMKALASEDVDARELLALVQSIEPALNREDVAFDLIHIATAARRFLDRAYSRAQPEALIFAAELLCDHAVGSAFKEHGASAFSSIATTRDQISEILPTGFRLAMLGLTESGRLISVVVVGRDVENIISESQQGFSADALQKWAQRFPYDYAYDGDPNVFWVSTNDLVITLAEEMKTIFVMDTRLQKFPPNLIRIAENFAGLRFPVCSSPSVLWLSTIRKNQTGTATHRNAWIPAGEDTALAWLAERLESSLFANGFTLNRDAGVPNSFRSSEVAIIAAHGGLLPEGKFIQRISAGDQIAIYPDTLASACAGSALVILFICSGGRVDSHPESQTTVGLVKQLLDQGCKGIVASPWPLDVRVPPNWFPIFMDGWTSGDTVIDAVFHANAYLARTLGPELRDSLAMNLFGDPFLRPSEHNAPELT